MRVHHVAHLALREPDDAAVDDDVRVRPVEHEEVREAGHRHAEVGAGVAVPAAVQVDAAAADDLHRREEPRRLEAGAVDQHVELVQLAVDGHDALRHDPGDARRGERDVVAVQRLRPHAVVDDDPLGRRRVLRQRLLEQVGTLRVLRLDRLGEQLAQQVVELADRARLVGPVRVDLGHRAQQLGATSRTARSGTTGGSTARGGAGTGSPAGTSWVVRHGEHPVRRALEDLEVRDLLGDDRHELGRAAAGADDADPLAGEVDAVVPAGGVERRRRRSVSRPSMFGSCGRLSWPTALITALAWIVGLVAVLVDGAARVHVAVASSYTTDETSVLKRMFGRMPNSSTHSRKYLCSSALGQ